MKSFSIALLSSIASTQATVSSTGFTVSLTDIDYFLPPKPVASIAGCDEIKAAFADGPFVPFTVVKGDGYRTLDLSSVTAKYAEQDDVWQEGFLDGTDWRLHLHKILLTFGSTVHTGWQHREYLRNDYHWYSIR
jgi:hypothetical protein